MDQKPVDLIYNHNSVNKRLVFVNQRVFIIYNLSFRKQETFNLIRNSHISFNATFSEYPKKINTI